MKGARELLAKLGHRKGSIQRVRATMHNMRRKQILAEHPGMKFKQLKPKYNLI